MSSDDKDAKEGSLNVEVGASAKYEVKKRVIQTVPDDVTRARSNAWLDLISPFMEWSGLKGDALRHKRELLRIETQESLYRVGLQAKRRIAELGINANPVPTKALIPILEKASLENPDSALIEAWGNLLASASVDYDVEVITFAEILSMIGPREAAIIQEIVGDNTLERWRDRSRRATAAPDFDVYDNPDIIKPMVLEGIENKNQGVFNQLRKFFPTGYPIHIAKIQKGVATRRANKIHTIVESDFFRANAPGFEILEKQGLIQPRYAGFSWKTNSDDGPSGVGWYELTELGFAFALRVSKETQ